MYPVPHVSHGRSGNTPRVSYTGTSTSGVVGDDRDYYVYTPAGYEQTSKKTYPVLYTCSTDSVTMPAVGRRLAAPTSSSKI